jgi:hypothetical protein
MLNRWFFQAVTFCQIDAVLYKSLKLRPLCPPSFREGGQKERVKTWKRKEELVVE